MKRNKVRKERFFHSFFLSLDDPDQKTAQQNLTTVMTTHNAHRLLSPEKERKTFFAFVFSPARLEPLFDRWEKSLLGRLRSILSRPDFLRTNPRRRD